MLYDYILGHSGVVMWTGAEILDWYRSQVPVSRAA
jgi:allantoinase